MRTRTALLKTAAAGLLAAALSVGAAHAQSWDQSQKTTTIANGTSLSGAVDMGNGRLFAIVIPSAWTTGNLTFQASSDCISAASPTYSNMFDSTGTEVTFTVAASQYIINAVPVEWIGVRCIKVRSGTSGTPVNQGADRALVIITVPF